jgi:hypothetical protein
MATSPSFNWPEPDNSDLVKNGALAIRTAVNAIDASMTDLRGGTTGQVLAKASNTDMDFTWSAGASVPTSLGFAAGKNAIINGDFLVNQRSFTSNTTSGTFNFDRWLQYNTGGSFTLTPQNFTPGAAPIAGYEGRTFLQAITASQSAAGDFAQIVQTIEDVTRYAGNTVTVSFFAKANTGTPKIALELQQAFGTGGSPSSIVNTVGGTVTLSTSWARYSLTVAVPSISGKTLGTTANTSYLGVNLWTSAGSNFNSRASSIGIQNFTASIWGVQVEAGSTATAFQTATGTIQGELAACQRYYWRFTATAGGANYLCLGRTTTQVDVEIQHPVQMRRSPTDIEYGGTTDISDINVAGYNTTSLTFANASVLFASIRANIGQASLAQGKTYVFGVQANAYYGFSAEL